VTFKPLEIKLHKRSNVLELKFTSANYELPAEYLRVYSPSAEVQGHSPSEAKLQYGKAQVRLISIYPQGHYAVRLAFDDGHDSGIYTWEYLYEMCVHQEERWQQYLDKLHHAKKTREPNQGVVRIIE